jgi:HEAT repeat protein
MTGNDEPENGEAEESTTRAFESGREEREAHYPDEGYNLVEIDLMRPPGEALTLLSHHLTLSSITIPPATEFEDYVVYDQHGHAYDHDELQTPSEAVDTTDIDGLIDAIQASESKPKRLGLLELARLTETNPSAGLATVPALTSELQVSDRAVQAEILTILSHLAQEHPEEVTSAAANVIEFLTLETEPEILADAINIVAAIADSNPGTVVDAVPKLAALLQDGSPADATAITAIQRVAEAYSDAVAPITPQLIAYLDGSDETHRIGALAVLGTLSKDYPNVAEETIPTAIELLDAGHYKLRANAAGLLADLADEYPDQVKPVVPQAIELLEDPDEKARYNATSILARVAKADPDAVEPAINPLIDALDEDLAYTRSNACWALGYLKANDAVDRLREVEETDSNEEVRHAASVAIDEIESR